MTNVADRKRSFDTNKLNKDEAEQLSTDIGVKVRQICDEACEKANKILNIYGMKAQMQIAINEINEEKPEMAPPAAPKKRGRPRKATAILS